MEPNGPADGVMFGWLSHGAASGAIVNVTVPGVQPDELQALTATPYIPSAVGIPVMAPVGVTTTPGGIRLGLVTVKVVMPLGLPGSWLATGWFPVPFSTRLGTTGIPRSAGAAAAADPTAGPASAMATNGGTASHVVIPVSLSRAVRVMLSPRIRECVRHARRIRARRP
jgi:hypothetical protein